MSTPAFYAIIPANVRYCKDLEPNAKLLYGEITALAQQEGYCWATNQYFADLYEVDISTVKRWIQSLKDNKLIEVESTKNGIHTQRRIWVSLEIKKMFTKAQKCATPGSKMSHPQLKNEPHINTYNTTSNKNPLQVPKAKDPETKEDWRRFFSDWSKEEFEFAWGELEKAPKGSVKSIKSWLAKVRHRFTEISQGKAVSDALIEKHKRIAKFWDGAKWNGDRVTALKDRVEFTDGPHCKIVRYDVSQHEWEEKTGWKS